MSWTEYMPLLEDDALPDLTDHESLFQQPVPVHDTALPHDCTHIVTIWLGPHQRDRLLAKDVDDLAMVGLQAHENYASAFETRTALGFLVVELKQFEKVRPDVFFDLYLHPILKKHWGRFRGVNTRVTELSSSDVKDPASWFLPLRWLDLPDVLVTQSHLARMEKLKADIARTEEVAKLNMHGWRVTDFDPAPNPEKRPYSPVAANSCGWCCPYPIRSLLAAFQQPTCQEEFSFRKAVPFCRDEATDLPPHPQGMLEWFLLICLYPRLCQNLFLTYVNPIAQHPLAILDVEYAMWANPGNQFIYQNNICC